MGKLKLQVQISIDGYIAGPNGEMDWMIWNWDDQLKKHVSEINQSIGTILLGRKLAEGFIPTWAEMAGNPDTADDFAKKVNITPKVVFSRTLEQSKWPNTVVCAGDTIAEINRLKSQSYTDIIAYGGANFVSGLIKYNLIDEYHLFVNPVVLGRGMSIFNERDEQLNLTLVNSTAFECGIVETFFQANL